MKNIRIENHFYVAKDQAQIKAASNHCLIYL